MGGKGNQVQTQSTQTYSPNPAIARAGNQALTGAESAAQLPFQQPVAPVAGFNPFQQQAFNQIQGMQGMAQPYFNMGNAYLQGSAAPISGQDVSQYYNPMAANITAQMQNIFGQQMHQATGNATQAAGGVGADRIGVAQANLANQQGLAAGQTYAGLYNQALQAAQQQKQMMAGAGYGLAQMGPAAQNAYLQGTGALGQAGAQQQGLTQAQLSAQYQNQLAQIAYPFQTPQYLAGITGGLAPAFGGTTQGQSTTTYPTPSPLNQALGVGTSLAGLAMGGPFGGMLGGALGGGLGSMFGGGGGKGSSPSVFGGSFGSGGAAYGKLAEQRFANSPVGNPYADSSDDSNYADGGDALRPVDRTAPDFNPHGPFGQAAQDRRDWDAMMARQARARAERQQRESFDQKNNGFADGGDIEQPPPFPGASVPNNSGMSPIPTMGQIPQGISPIPYIPLHPAPMQHPNLDLRPQSKTPPKLQGQETIGGDISSALKLAKGVGLFSASGGAVNPYDLGRGFQDGGDTFDDRWGDMSTNVLPDTLPPLPRGDPRTPLGARATMANELSRAGMSPTGIGGTNMAVADESGFNPYSRVADQPRFGGEAHYAHGLFQEGGDEWNKYQSWLKQNHPDSDWRDPALQTRFLSENMKENYPEVFNRMNAANTPGQSAAAFTSGYLKPAAGPLNARMAKYLGSQGAEDTTELSARERNPYSTNAPNADMNAGQYFLPKGDQPYPDSLNRDWGQNAIRSPWMSLVSAGAKMASTVGPVGTAIGKGIEAGVGQLEGQRKELRSEQDINMKALKLYQETQQHLDEYKRQKPLTEYQAGELGLAKERIQQEIWQPTGTLDVTGAPLLFNKKTGETKTANAIGNAGGASPADASAYEWAKNNPDNARAAGLLGDAERYIKTGTLPANMGRGQQGAQEAQRIRTIAYQMAAERGVSADQLPKQWQQFRSEQTAINRFMSGPQGNTARSLNVVVDHAETLRSLGEALKNGNIQVFNKIAQTWAEQTGHSAPTSFDMTKAIVGTEVIKALGVAGAGTEDERAELGKRLSRASSPEQLNDVIDKAIKPLLGGQLRGLRQQFKVSTGLPEEKFNEALFPQTLKYLDTGKTGPHEGDRKQFKQGWGVYRDGQWIPE